MDFNKSNLTIVLDAIEEKLCFVGNDLSSPQDWNFQIGLPVQDIIDKSPKESEKIRYAIKVLEVLGYIKFKNEDYSVIDDITSLGLKYLFRSKYGIDFI